MMTSSLAVMKDVEDEMVYVSGQEIKSVNKEGSSDVLLPRLHHPYSSSASWRDFVVQSISRKEIPFTRYGPCHVSDSVS